MKVIDLLVKIANGEETPKKIRIDHWCYTFEWVEHDSNYYDKHEDIDLMSCLSMDKEELNYGVHELKEDKEIEELDLIEKINNDLNIANNYSKNNIKNNLKYVANKINELIDEVNKLKKDKENE